LQGRVLILHARRYDFKDKETGKDIVGCKVVYSDGQLVVSDEESGLQLQDAKMNVKLYNYLDIVPGWYDVQATVNKGKVEFSGVKFVAPFGSSSDVPAGELVGATN
jgi:putative sterol carrier protein